MKGKISLDSSSEEYKSFYEDFYEKSDVDIHDPVLRFVAHDVIMSNLSLGNTSESEGMLLDVGQGSGVISRLIADSTKLKCFGFDISETTVKKAHKNHHGHNCHFVVGSAESIPFKDNTFDYVSANHILEHIPDDTAALHEIYRVIKKGGKLYLASPNDKKDIFFAFRRYRSRCDVATGHLRSGYSKEDIISKLEKEGFRIDKYKGVNYIFRIFIYPYISLVASVLYRIYSRCSGKSSGYSKLYLDIMYKIRCLVDKIDDTHINLFFKKSYYDFYLIATKIKEGR